MAHGWIALVGEGNPCVRRRGLNVDRPRNLAKTVTVE